ncbi:MAG: cytochrome C [Myxococcota bacterium]
MTRNSVLCGGVVSALSLLGAGGCTEVENNPVESSPESRRLFEPAPTSTQALKKAREIVKDEPTDIDTPIGIALEINDGVGLPLRVRKRQRVFINQIDILAAVATSTDTGLKTVQRESDLAALDWRGIEFEEEEPVLTANPDGTFVNRRFFRGARWMENPSVIFVWQENKRGRIVSLPIPLFIGGADRERDSDAFFVRRLRGLQFINDCEGLTECDSATSFVEEALVELRNARTPASTFRLRRSATRLRVWWSARAGRPYTIPLTQVAAPEWDYGFKISLEAVTPPGPQGFYEPGSDVTFRITLTDGAGKRLHPEGSLPTYADVVFEGVDSGIQYYRAFFDAAATFWRRKHRERMLMVQIAGPNQDAQPMRTIAPLELFLDEADTEIVATPEVDGVYGEFTLLPPANVIFGGAFTPENPQWFEPNVDTFTFHLPENAGAGTYRLAAKGRRTYLGEDIPQSSFLEIQVGTNAQTEPELFTGPCNTCHSAGGDLDLVLHGSDDRAACSSCHVPLGFELEGPIATRLHFIHSRSEGRYGEPLERCATCHLGNDTIQRTSKHACLSCHRDYPDDHVEWFGPIENIYIGGGPESFQQCTDTCHTTHPGSGFREH